MGERGTGVVARLDNILAAAGGRFFSSSLRQEGHRNHHVLALDSGRTVCAVPAINGGELELITDGDLYVN